MNSIKKLYDNGIQIELFVEKMIKDIDSSNNKISITKVIDFDDVKNKVTKSINQGKSEENHYSFKTPKSCDALKIVHDKECIDFIEFKSFEEFKKRQVHNKNDIKKVESQIKKFDLELKIIDSYDVFNMILKFYEMELTNEERKKINSIKKNYFVMVDISIEEDAVSNFATTLMFVSEPSVNGKIIETLKNNLNGIDMPVNFNRPKLISSKTIDKYYKGL